MLKLKQKSNDFNLNNYQRKSLQKINLYLNTPHNISITINRTNILLPFIIQIFQNISNIPTHP